MNYFRNPNNFSAVAMVALGALVFQPAQAADDPNAAIAAETARLTAEAARINAEAALITARATRERSAVENLGLPKFDNKTTLTEGGGAIETSLLATAAVSAAAVSIKSAIAGAQGLSCANNGRMLVLAGNQKFDLNAGNTLLARMSFVSRTLSDAMPRRAGGPKPLALPAITAAISAAAGLFGNEATISGVKLDEISDEMLANEVAGKLPSCAVLPSAGPWLADVEGSEIAKTLAVVYAKRTDAAKVLAALPAKPNPAQTARATDLQGAIAQFDGFYKEISTPGADGSTPFVNAILADSLAARSNLHILRVAVNRAGGTITNSKNIGTFIGLDPVRVSGGLVANYAVVNALDGTIAAAGAVACRTARVRLNRVQDGTWHGGAADSRNKTPVATCT